MARDRSSKKRRHSTRRDPERTRSAILDAATAMFTRCGLNGASLDDISKEAGINRGLIYHYFKTKESLFDQVLAKPLTEFSQSQLQLLQSSEFDAVSLRGATESFARKAPIRSTAARKTCSPAAAVAPRGSPAPEAGA